MAKFRQGNLVLSSTQKIIQGSNTLVDVAGNATFSKLNILGTTELNSLKLASGATVTVFDTDTNLAANSDSRIPTQKALKTYIDSQVGGAVTPGSDNKIARYDGINSVQDSLVTIDDFGNVSGFNNLSISAMATLPSLKLNLGATITEFSTDTNLAGNSDTAVPTEKALKTYIDTQVHL